MALPALKTLPECADFAKTVAPFLPQLYALPTNMVSVVVRRQSLVDLYAQTNPVITGFGLSVALGAVFLVAAEINRNYSQVDRFWSILPTIHVAHFALWAHLVGVPTQRVHIILLFTTLWSIRLTFNYWRKGGYAVGSEDYRWEILRKQIPTWAFYLLNWTFISFIQSILLFLLAVPAYVVLLTTLFEPEVQAADLALLAVEMALVVVEIVADQQQWDFQSAKKEYQQTAKVPAGFDQEELDRGFIHSGLWAYSRHPNFAAEQMIWFVLYQWACFSSKAMFSWSGVGALSLILLFQSSTNLTESITAGKYPEYKHYQQSVSKYIPTQFSGYRTCVSSVRKPKIIRTSEIEERLAKKQK